jgi:phosphatidylinositol-3-phosphatase
MNLISRATATLSLVLAGCVAAGSGVQLPTRDASAVLAPKSVGPHATYVTIVLMENKDYNLVIGSRHAPFLNKHLIPIGVLLRNSHAIGHPSEPNYLALFSGSTQGVQGDPCPVYFNATNIASELIAADKTFGGYSESMPHDGYKGCYTKLYDRNHNPWVDFKNVPATDNKVYNGFPGSPPSFTWITPNLCDDTHDCSIAHGDKWLSTNIPPIVYWNATHDGLLILTWDEASPDNSGKNHVATVLVGPMIAAGKNDTQNVDHYAVLHTIETIFKLPCIDKDCNAPLITGIWK